MTLQLLWQEYVQTNECAYGRSYFVELYRQWEATAYPRMRQVHAPGDKLFIDYAGHTVPIIDRLTGEVLFQAQIYTATMGASNYTYAEATRSQDQHDWIGSNIRALEFFGGVPRAIVPDNLKSGVTSADQSALYVLRELGSRLEARQSDSRQVAIVGTILPR